MKFFSSFRMVALFALALQLVSTRAGAQGIGLFAAASTNSIAVSNSLTYTIVVTNNTGIQLYDVNVTNLLSAPAQFISYSESQGTLANATNGVVFLLGFMDVGTLADISLTVQPATLGNLTNAIVATTTTVTNTAATNVVVQVAAAQTDLGVAFVGFPSAILVNDQITYGVIVTNLGANPAPGFTLTNTLPPGVLLKSVSPANQTYTTNGNNLIFNFGTLAAGASTNLQFTIQPTTAGTNTFSAAIAGGFFVTNSPSAGTNIIVLNYLPATLTVVTNSSQNPDVVSGLTEQTILASNTGTNDVPAVRVVVTGLTNRLFNAVGTNDGNPFVVYAHKLGTNQNVNLLLQFYPSTIFPFTNGQLHAYAVPVPDWTPPAATATSTNINISRIVKLNNGWKLIEFPTTLGRTYTVVYSDNALFSNAMIAPPSITAPANRVQWIDYGPPTTISAPTNAGSRFYRVFLNQ